jgi:hypothetical protein
MNTEVYRFKVGTLDCMAVSDGTFTYAPPTFPPPATLLFANAPSEELEQVLREHKLQPAEWGEWISPYICLLINTDEHFVITCSTRGLHLRRSTQLSSPTGTRITSEETLIARASQPFRAPAT